MPSGKRFAFAALAGCAALSLAGLAQTVPVTTDTPPITTSTDAKPILVPSKLLTIQHMVAPALPPAAKAAKLSGTVELHFIVTKTGAVTDLRVAGSPPPMLAKAAMDAVQQWIYKPYIHGGAPVDVETMITLNFRE